MLAAAGLLVWGVGSAGAHGGDTNKVHSCIVPSSGYAQIIGANETCSKNYRALDWSAADTNTTYSAGSGLSLSAANVFSVTGAPWIGLTGVPAGFADGVDDVGGSTTWSGLVGVPDGFRDDIDNEGSMQWDDLTGVPDGFDDGIDDEGSMVWGDLTGVPLEFADGDDDDGSSGLAQLVSQLSNADGTPNESDDPVSFTKIKDLGSSLGGRILGSFIQDGTIGGEDIADNAIGSNKLAGTYSGGVESTPGAVTSEKIRDASIEGRDLGTVVQNVTTSATMGTLQAGTRSTVTISVPGVRTNDLVTVSPPFTLDDDLIFSGSDVLTDDVVTVYLYNPTANAIDGGFQNWKIRWLNTDG